MLDRIIFGDNQFFGINHMSEEKAQDLSEKFSDLNSIIDVINIAYDSGIRAFMLNANERVKDICDQLRSNLSRYADLRLYPSIPYPYKYANSVAEKGLLRTMMDVVFYEINIKNILGIFARGSLSLFKKDMIKGIQLLIDAEMRIFQGLDIKVIFLHNILTDLLLGFGIKDIFLGYASYIKERYKAEPGFITLNLPKLINFLLDCRIENPIICSSINKIGYFMNPDKKAYENVLNDGKCRPIAMSIFASGAIKPNEAVEYVCRQLNIRSVVFGASSEKHIKETKKIIESYF